MLVGAGGINALTGEKLGITLEKDNYLVAPPQPWLDGWKDKDGTVYQFVATAYKKGAGITVAEQLMGEDSKMGAIGIAFFDPKDESKLKISRKPVEGFTDSIGGNDFNWQGSEFTDLLSLDQKIQCAAMAAKPSSSGDHILSSVRTKF